MFNLICVCFKGLVFIESDSKSTRKHGFKVVDIFHNQCVFIVQGFTELVLASSILKVSLHLTGGFSAYGAFR